MADYQPVCFDADLIRRYDGRGPRYTSYPTALQFTDEFTADRYQQVAAASNASKRPLSLYVHIPFCRSLCYYCACNKIVTRNRERVEKYLRHLFREIDMQAALFDDERRVEQLHFGGGTPTYLGAGELTSLMSRLRQAFSFDDGDRREFSIEVDPRTVDSAMMATLIELGFNRLSLGIQDFDPAVQVAVNRVQSADNVDDLVRDARDGGFRSVSFDLIYGLPLQTVATFDRTLDTVLGMRPDRLAIYNYAHLPARFRGQRMIDDAAIPPADVKLDILRHTIGKLAESDYVYIGMDHFALPQDDLVAARANGTLQRNFQGYSTHGGCDLIGLGVSAIGHIGNAFAQNTTSTIEYETLLHDGRLPIRRGIDVDADDRIRASAINRLMCFDRIDMNDFGTEHGIDFAAYFEPELGRLESLAEDELVAIDGDAIAVTAKGRLLLRNVAMVFDRHFAEAGGDVRFSKAI